MIVNKERFKRLPILKWRMIRKRVVHKAVIRPILELPKERAVVKKTALKNKR